MIQQFTIKWTYVIRREFAEHSEFLKCLSFIPCNYLAILHLFIEEQGK